MKTKYDHIEEATTGLFDQHEMDITGLSEGIESLRDNTIADAAPRLLLKSTPTHHAKRMTITELYAQFIEHQNKDK